MIAFLFPGQGSQAVGMGKAFHDASAAARAVFDEANAALGFDLRRVMFEGPESELALTTNTQPAVLEPSTDESGLIDFDLYSDGKYWDLLYMPGGGSRYPATHETVDKRMHYAKMKGAEVFKVAVRMFAECTERILTRNGFTADDVTLFIPHQANLRIIEAAVKRVNLPMERVFTNVDRYGNTGAASVYVALEEALAAGRIKKGDLILMAAFGGGFAWGAALLRW